MNNDLGTIENNIELDLSTNYFLGVLRGVMRCTCFGLRNSIYSYYQYCASGLAVEDWITANYEVVWDEIRTHDLPDKTRGCTILKLPERFPVISTGAREVFVLLGFVSKYDNNEKHNVIVILV